MKQHTFEQGEGFARLRVQGGWIYFVESFGGGTVYVPDSREILTGVLEALTKIERMRP